VVEMFEKYNIEEEFEDYSNIINKLITNRKTLALCKRVIDAKEGEIYTRIHSEMDATGKSLYRNEELRKIAVSSELSTLEQYQEYQTEKLLNIELELKFIEKQELLKLLKQEREFNLKVVNNGKKEMP
jgi:hypothetical protein